MIVQEIMTTEVISAKEETPISRIAEIVSNKRIHGVPVVDGENKVIGIITETDFFTKDSSNIRYMPQLIDFMKNGKGQGGVAEDPVIKTVIHATAGDIMTKDCVTVRPETSLEELILLIKKHNFNTFPVVNENGVLVGIVTVFDMIRMI